jgi:NADPH:quinone reductase
VRAAHAELTRLADEGVVAPLIGETRGLDEVPAGLQALADGTTVGRVVFSPAASS